MHALISGAGIAGPTLAWFLSKAGIRVTVIEKAKTTLDQGQSIDLEGSALTIMEKMGVLDSIWKLNTGEKGTQLIGPKGKPFALFPLNENTSMSLTSNYEILRGDLAGLLYKHTKDLPNVNYSFDTTVQEVISNGPDAIKVALSTGETRNYDFLVAADGQWSRIRRKNFPAQDTEVVEMNMYVAYWTVPRLPQDDDYWNIYSALDSRIITLRPDPHGNARAMLTHMPCNDAQKQVWQEALKSGRQAQQELLRQDFNDAGWQTKRLLAAMDHSQDFYFQAIQQIRMAKWSTSRIICLGDAAYAPTPLTGAGTSLAVNGAYVLAGELSKLAPHQDPAVAFAAYERLYRPFVESQQKIPACFPDIAFPRFAWQRWLLQTSLMAVARVVALVVASPWQANRTKRIMEPDFPLPEYAVFDGDGMSGDGEDLEVK